MGSLAGRHLAGLVVAQEGENHALGLATRWGKITGKSNRGEINWLAQGAKYRAAIVAF